jgi:hypothetical protein
LAFQRKSPAAIGIKTSFPAFVEGLRTGLCRPAVRGKISRVAVWQECQRLVSNEMPSKCALTAVAPGVRFSALAIFATGALRAIDLSVFTSAFVHSRRTGLFFLARIIAPDFAGAGF